MVNDILFYNAKVYLSPGQFAEAVLVRGSRIAAKNGIQVVTHCIGDAAIEQVADCYIQCNAELSGRTQSKNPLRHGLVHCQITDQPLLQKIADNDLLTLVQPVFLEADIPILDDLITQELAATSYGLRKSGPQLRAACQSGNRLPGGRHQKNASPDDHGQRERRL